MEKYVLKKVDKIRKYNSSTGVHDFTLGDLQSVKFSTSSDTVYAEGANGSHLAAFDQAKVVSLEATNGAIVSGALASTAGTTEVTVTAGNEIKLREKYKITSTTKLVMNHVARGDVGVEIGWIYKGDGNGDPDSSNKFAQGAAAGADTFSYDPATKTITLPTNVFKVGDTVIVDYHPRFSEYKKITSKSDEFSVAGDIWVDAWFTDLCTQDDVPMFLHMPAGKVSAKFDMSFGKEAAVQAITIEGVESSCAGASHVQWELYTADMEKIDDTNG